MARQDKKPSDTRPIVIQRAPTVIGRTGLTRRTLDRKVAEGTFPAPVQLGPQSVGWIESEVTEWLETRPRTKSREPHATEPTEAA